MINMNICIKTVNNAYKKILKELLIIYPISLKSSKYSKKKNIYPIFNSNTNNTMK